ncbi:unnamed protein product [Rotaria sp. Silwood2]|nr:unnamed protein product [Rotaria sp. Silwood2]CAF3511809.1 unnamed protein product [Rotaria sp. Silwood2]CAF4463994.1 unnamed protein product [Rotaria sp. Silwood2]CAF4747608.1 unnamed protein product [Rotaria sp. Silwood2]
MLTCILKVNDNTRWSQNGITVCGGNQRGNGLNQLYHPMGICVDDDEETIYIADSFNQRIIECKYGTTNGKIVAGGNGSGDQDDQMSRPTDIVINKENDCFIICDQGNNRIVRWPRRNGTSGQTIISNIVCTGLAMDNNGYFYTSDLKTSEVRRWIIGDPRGVVVAGGNGQGSRLNQLDGPGYLFVDQDYSIYISDEHNRRVMKWIKGATQGIIVAGGHGIGNDLSQLASPRGVIADKSGTVYVADYINNRIMCWFKEAKRGTIVIDGNNEDDESRQLSYPQDLSFDRQGNLYVVDFGNDRIQRFNIVSNSS